MEAIVKTCKPTSNLYRMQSKGKDTIKLQSQYNTFFYFNYYIVFIILVTIGNLKEKNTKLSYKVLENIFIVIEFVEAL